MVDLAASFSLNKVGVVPSVANAQNFLCCLGITPSQRNIVSLSTLVCTSLFPPCEVIGFGNRTKDVHEAN